MRKITTLCLFLLCCAANAQVQYELTVLNETYVNLENTTSINNGEIWDDPLFEIPVGFEFQLGLLTVDMLFTGGSGGIISTTPDFDGSEGDIGALGPLLQDITDRGSGSSTSLSPISFRLDGDPGSQILKVEWNNTGFFNNSNLEDFVNFQMWIYEESDVIEFRYGPNEINNPNQSFDGLTGIAVGLFPFVPIDGDANDSGQESYILSGDPLNPDIVLINTPEDFDNTIDVALTGAIPDGTVYRFSPETLSVNDVSFSAEVDIYPNPTSDFFRIKSDIESYSVQIYNVAGLQIEQILERKQQYDISNLAAGVYFVKVVSDSGVVTKRLIKR